ncbi:sensor histidine kinase KdpD [Pleionea sp. CnH1-48]|uniref:sensor histidine kinase n=1 Tax=Pleionea sp. CnH1-48 TaxID=2954494 RepID=UPI002096C060|nr:ATP-binding protein [Pleionea sp. CnH1-48]MCO7224594.1 ATP-binding protein [Pleionea sp. CnH1-48]
MRAFFVQLFLTITLSNYILLYVYDNYYIPHLGESHFNSVVERLSQLSDDIQSKVNKLDVVEEEHLNQWSQEVDLPIHWQALDEPGINSAVVGELMVVNGTIDYNAEYGPTAYIKVTDKKAIAIGPIQDMFEISTTEQPEYIGLFLLVNSAIFVLFYLFFSKKAALLERAADEILQGGRVSEFELATATELRGVGKRIGQFGSYIRELEYQNQQIIEEQRDLMHAVAHELRSPIARFSFALELLSSDLSDKSQKLLTELHESIDELEELIREILNYSRLTNGKVELHYEKLDIVKLIQPLLERMRSLYPGTQFKLDCSQSRTDMEADERLLSRAAINVIRNAARFAKSTVVVTVTDNKNDLVITIDDDGMGIPPGKRERIFEAFTRLDPSRSRDSGGVGLGLAIVKRIIDKHQGRIRCAESPDGGARFELFLPYNKP